MIRKPAAEQVLRRARRYGRSSALCVLVSLALPATVGAVTETAGSGTVTAAFSYDLARNPELSFGGTYTNEEVTISRAGAPVYSKVLCTGPICSYPLGALDASFPTVEVAELESDGEPDVLVHLTTGGNGCCQEDRIFRWDAAASTYDMTERNWASFTGVKLADLGHDGKLEFVSGDPRFWAEFGSPGGSAYPLQLFIFRVGVFTPLCMPARSWSCSSSSSCC